MLSACRATHLMVATGCWKESEEAWSAAPGPHMLLIDMRPMSMLVAGLMRMPAATLLPLCARRRLRMLQQPLHRPVTGGRRRSYWQQQLNHAALLHAGCRVDRARACFVLCIRIRACLHSVPSMSLFLRALQRYGETRYHVVHHTLTAQKHYLGPLLRAERRGTSSSRLTTSSRPVSAAVCRGVMWPCALAFGSAPALSNNRTSSMLPGARPHVCSAARREPLSSRLPFRRPRQGAYQRLLPGTAR